MTLPLFVYGTLLDETFTSNLLERPVRGEPARLLDFECLTLEGLPFPALFYASGETVEGRLYRDLTAADYERLDAYEGVQEDLFRRVEARIVAGGEGRKGASETASIYVVTEKTLRRLGAL